MSMKLSTMIGILQRALEKHGDMPVYANESDIERLTIEPCRDGVYATTNGVPDEPNEYYLEFIPA